MPNPLQIKGSRTKVLNTFPKRELGNDGDIIISRIKGKGVYLCTKAGGMWYVANQLQVQCLLTQYKIDVCMYT